MNPPIRAVISVRNPGVIANPQSSLLGKNIVLLLLPIACSFDIYTDLVVNIVHLSNNSKFNLLRQTLKSTPGTPDKLHREPSRCHSCQISPTK